MARAEREREAARARIEKRIAREMSWLRVKVIAKRAVGEEGRGL